MSRRQPRLRRGGARRPLVVSAWAGAVLMVLVGLVGPPAAAGTPVVTAAAAASVDDTVAIKGRGWGHGRGMSQWGAQGQALAGLGYAQVLGFYYPGDTVSTRAKGTIRARVGSEQSAYVLTGLDGGTLTSAGGAVLDWTGRGDEVRLASVGGVVEVWQREGVSWVRSVTPGWSAGGAVTATGGDLLGRRRDDGGLDRYRGALRVHSTGAARADLLSVLPMESYLYSVVASEMPSSFRPAALQAQAVAARSYAQFPCSGGRSHYDVESTTACQVYRGHSTVSAAGTTTTHESAAVRSAVDATRDRVLLRNGAPVRTEFSSSNGGHTTASNGWPAKADPWDDDDPRNANASWSTLVRVSLVQTRWPEIGTFVRFGRTVRTGVGPFGGRVVSQQVVGSRGTVTVTGDALRSALGLRSTLLEFSDAGSELVLHNQVTGQLSVVELAADGRASSSLSTTTLARYDVVVPVEVDGTGGTELVLYDSKDGRVAVHDVDGSGNLSAPLSTTVWSGWDVIVPIEVDGTIGSELLLYDTVGGRQTVVDLNARGQASRPLSETVWSRWDYVVPVEVDRGPGSELLLYDTRSGRQAVVDLSPSGRASRPLSQTTWSSWDTVVPVETDGTAGSELIVYNTVTGRQAVVDLSSTGRASRPLSQTSWSLWDTVVPVELDGTSGSELVLFDSRSRRQAVVDLSPSGVASRALSETTWSGWTSVVPVQLP